MVVVTCELSMSIRRHAPDEDSTFYIHTLQRVITDICRRASLTVLSATDPPPVDMPKYNDKLVKRKYELSSTVRRYAEAEERLLKAFQLHCNSSKEANVFFYLNIDPEPDGDLAVYFRDVQLKTYALGFMSNPVRFHSQFHYQMELRAVTGHDPCVSVEIDSQKLAVIFKVSNVRSSARVPQDEVAPTTEIYRLMIDFQQLSSTLLVNTTEDAVDLCFLTKTPIQLWRPQYDLADFLWLLRAPEAFDRKKWIRTCSISSASEFANQCDINKATLGGCNGLMLRFGRDAESRSVLQSLVTYGGFVAYHTVLEYRPKVPLSKPPPYVERRDRNLDNINWMLAALHSIGYRIRHQLEDQTIFRPFIGMVIEHVHGSQDDCKHLLNALCRTYDTLAMDTEDFLHIDRVLEYCLSRPSELDELVCVHSKLVKRLIVSPSRILFQAPCLNHDNRILREFDVDSAVSCSFQNDDLTRFSSHASMTYNFVEEVVGEFLRKGVVVAKRHYEFLGCSGSQLKEVGCWLYAEDSNGATAEDIRDWMGDLELIRNAGTYLSRMGQCFSDTTAAVLDADIDIDWEGEDVEGGRDPTGKPYCFSDGVGRISEECLKMVFARLPDQFLPSAFQVRLGGSKGMLTLDRRLTGKKIIVRKSMFKFHSRHTTVEVMRRTQPTPLFLNCQIITVLSQLRAGVPDRVFIRLLNTMLHKMADVLLDDREALAALSASGFSCCYAKLYNAGLKFTTDPFFKGMLKAITCSRINNVKQKARIEVPPEYGRYMLGVMDEEGVLEYGQVFIQYSADINKPKQNPIVLKGSVVVSKMPCFHPGDVRKFKAVDKPELRHLVDCIVFPSKGHRPHPNEMAGSDLDGDEYFVTWFKPLIFSGNNETPMDFLSIRKTEQATPISLKDMVDFIVGYIVNDKVGVIANAHLAWADQEDIYGDKCLDLARIFSHVIDFCKTGYLPPEVRGRGLVGLLAKKYPDFMGKQDHLPTYRSEKVMGKLYRISQRIAQYVSSIDNEDTERIDEGLNWVVDERFFVDGHELFLETAEKLYDIYAECLDTEQRRYGIESEEELVSGCVIKIKGMYSRSDEVFDIEKRLQERMKDVRKFVRNKFDELLEQSMIYGVGKKTQELMLAAACYVITYSNKCKHRSFPWVFSDQMLAILRRSEKPGCKTPLKTLTESIQSIDINRVERSFRLKFRIQRPDEDDLARIYLVLINWGQKTKFVMDQSPPGPTRLKIEEFAQLLDDVVQDDDKDVQNSLDADAGPLMIALLKGISDFDNKKLINGRRLSREALIRMKQQILLAHHQLARDPRIDSLMIRNEAMSNEKIWVDTDKWNAIKSHTGRLHQILRERFSVHTEFRRMKNGGLMWLRGKEGDVMDCIDFWIDEFDPRTLIQSTLDITNP